MVTGHPLHAIWEKVSTLAGKDKAISVSYYQNTKTFHFIVENYLKTRYIYVEKTSKYFVYLLTIASKYAILIT
jgi:hypothetical protein